MSRGSQVIGVGVAWNLFSLILRKGSSTIFTLILARLLSPEEFGLIAMIMIVLELAHHMVQSGLGQALIRSKSVSKEDLSTVFVTNLCFCIFIYGCIYVSAPYVASFYGKSEIVALLRCIGLAVFFEAIKVVPVAILTRAMDFRSQMVSESIAVFLSGVVAVGFAFLGGGVWSLVLQ